MSFIESLKQRFFEQQLQRALAVRPATTMPQAVHPSTAKTLAIIFSADDASERKLVEQLKSKRSKQGLKTQLLGFFSTKVSQEASYNFPFYSVQDLSWSGVPKGNEVAHFLADGCDLLYVLAPPSVQHMHYLGVLKPAGLRVGPYTFESDPENFYHVQYPGATSIGIKNALEQINRLFNIINAKETASV